jgi:hypothetical protein
MTEDHLEDHAIGVELQITELVEKRERALVQGDSDRAAVLEAEIAELQEDLMTPRSRSPIRTTPRRRSHAPEADETFDSL